jgi:hypothetical protein
MIYNKDIKEKFSSSVGGTIRNKNSPCLQETKTMSNKQKVIVWNICCV